MKTVCVLDFCDDLLKEAIEQYHLHIAGRQRFDCFRHYEWANWANDWLANRETDMVAIGKALVEIVAMKRALASGAMIAYAGEMEALEAMFLATKEAAKEISRPNHHGGLIWVNADEYRMCARCGKRVRCEDED